MHRHPFSLLFTLVPRSPAYCSHGNCQRWVGAGRRAEPQVITGLPRPEKRGQLGTADYDGRWGHRAGNLRAWPPLSLKQTA